MFFSMKEQPNFDRKTVIFCKTLKFYPIPQSLIKIGNASFKSWKTQKNLSEPGNVSEKCKLKIQKNHIASIEPPKKNPGSLFHTTSQLKTIKPKNF